MRCFHHRALVNKNDEASASYRSIFSLHQHHPGGTVLRGLPHRGGRRLRDRRLGPSVRPGHGAQYRSALHLLSSLHEHRGYTGDFTGARDPKQGRDVPPSLNLYFYTEQMGRVLQRTSISTNIKERLDFSCAVFGPDGGLVSNAPHIPVHLGAMQETVQYQVRWTYCWNTSEQK